MAPAGIVRKAHCMDRLHVHLPVLPVTLDQAILLFVEVMVHGVKQDRALQVRTLVL